MSGKLSFTIDVQTGFDSPLSQLRFAHCKNEKKKHSHMELKTKPSPKMFKKID